MDEVNGRILQDNEDFLVELIVWRGQPAVRKSIKKTTPSERAARLQNEAYGMHFLTRLAANHPNLSLYIPKLYELNKSSLIREYIEPKPIVDSRAPAAENLERLDKLAKLLADIDRIKPYGEVKFVGHFDYRNIRKNFPKWTKEPLADGQITQAQIDKVSNMLDELEIYLEPRLTHGDLSPHSHAYFMPDSKIAFIDLENFTPSGARFYDVARAYVRLFSFDKPELAKGFLSSFLKYADDIEYRDEKLLAIILQRTLGMQYDAWYDAQKGTDYREQAKELLELVLQGRLELLYDSNQDNKSHTSGIKAVIFDCFGVLTTDGWIAFKKRHFRNNKELADKASELNYVAGTGDLSFKQFIDQVSDLAGISPSDTQHEIESNTADEELFEYINSLKPRYKIGMLSNAAANHLERLFTKDQLAVFDAIVLSYDSGVIKPEQRAYELIAERLNVQTTECVFIDDQAKHIEGARRAGMKTVLYTDFPSFKEKIEKFLAADADN